MTHFADLLCFTVIFALSFSLHQIPGNKQSLWCLTEALFGFLLFLLFLLFSPRLVYTTHPTSNYIIDNTMHLCAPMEGRTCMMLSWICLVKCGSDNGVWIPICKHVQALTWICACCWKGWGAHMHTWEICMGIHACAYNIKVTSGSVWSITVIMVVMCLCPSVWSITMLWHW